LPRWPHALHRQRRCRRLTPPALRYRGA
jgi:hypothetical protein